MLDFLGAVVFRHFVKARVFALVVSRRRNLDFGTMCTDSITPT